MISSLFVDALTPAQCAAAAPPSDDAGARSRRAVATAAAILVHAAAIALVLVTFPMARNPVETAAIDVEIVREAAPKPKAEPEPPPPPPAAEVQPERPRVSGGESDRAPGKPPEVASPPKPAAAPAQRPARPAPKKPAPISAPALPEAPSPEPIPAPTPPSPAAEHAAIPAPPLHPPPPKWWNTGPNPGEGGGDPYLNAVRDGILSRFLYPPEARDLGLSGTAQYQITLDRQGNLIGLRLVQSAGSSLLDAAGLETIRRAAPFGPVPPDVIGDRVGLIFTLHIAPASSSAE